MLRCDPSALGLLANGALAAAYGTRTSIRHLYPSQAAGETARPASRRCGPPDGPALP